MIFQVLRSSEVPLQMLHMLDSCYCSKQYSQQYNGVTMTMFQKQQASVTSSAAGLVVWPMT